MTTILRKSKIMKCPLCICNNAIIQWKDFILNCFGCVHNHTVQGKRFDEYAASQNIQFDSITCNKCRCNQNEETEDFRKCLKCSHNSKYAIYYCAKHSKNHPHETIPYDEKYYYCQNHFSQNNLFQSYCEDCAKNLCKLCENECEKNKHNVKKFVDINKDINPIKEQLKFINEQITELELFIENITDHIEKALLIFKNYSKIATDILKKYEKFNFKTNFKNYQVIKTIEYLEESNFQISSDLKNILENRNKFENWGKVCGKLIKMYKDDIAHYAKYEKDENKKKEKEKHILSTNLDEEVEEPNPAPDKIGTNARSIRNKHET